MHWSISPFFLLLPTLARSNPTPLSPRQFLPTAQDVIQDILNINAAVLALDYTIQSFQGGPLLSELVDSLPVISDGLAIHSANRAGLIHAVAALPFSVQDSITIINTVVSTVNKSIVASTEHIKEKQPMFKKSGQSFLVMMSLGLFLNDHDTFSAAVLSKLNGRVGQAKTQEGRDAVANIHNAIQEAMKFYASNVSE